MIVRTFVNIIRIYQRLVSPLFGDRCRFFPTCSQYSIEALRRHGSLKGFVLTIVRLSKCGPWNPGGIDPVP